MTRLDAFGPRRQNHSRCGTVWSLRSRTLRASRAIHSRSRIRRGALLTRDLRQSGTRPSRLSLPPPRSLHTALKSAHYFRGFNEDYGFCINSSFTQIYAVASEMSWANAKQFKKFCDAAKIPCEEIRSTQYFQDGLVDGAYITEEYTYDARILRDYLVAQISAPPAVPRAAILHRRSPLGR